MSRAPAAPGRRVVVVTGGGGGIGAAVAEELGRAGDVVVTLDPLVTSDGSTPLPPTEETTAGRIVAAGGTARASAASVTDAAAVHSLFADLVAEHGRLDAVVNVAGITRPTSFATGTEEDWRRVLAVHLDGYLNVLGAALPIMAAAGQGRILGVTSGSGWRSANAGAYGCAKRAVAALTWQFAAHAPPGVVVNAMSPIASTRMVTEALERAARARASNGAPATGGLALDSMPTAAEIGPLGAHLVGAGFDRCQGQVIFAGGSEAAVIDGPRLLEVVRSDGGAPLAPVLDAVLAGAWGPAEAAQLSAGATNPRFAHVFDDPGPDPSAPPPGADVRACVVVSDRPGLAGAVTAALDVRGVTCTPVVPDGHGGFAGADGALAGVVARVGPVDAVVLAPAGGAAARAREPWQQVLAEHEGIAEGIHADAAWVRAVAGYSAAAGRPVRLVTLTDATTSGGASRAQASAQLARAAIGATDGRVAAFAVSIETPAADDERAVAALASHLVCGTDTPALSGAELAAGPGWLGLRSHPRPRASVVYGGPDLPVWFDDVLHDIAGGGVAAPPSGAPAGEAR